MDWLTVILLLVAGIILLVIEIIFVPGTTIVGIIGVALLVFGVIIGYSNFGPVTGTIVLVLTALTGATVTFMSFKTGVWKRFALKNTNEARFNEDLELEHLLGAEGTTVSALRPYGKAEIYEKTYEVKTLGLYLNAGTRIRVTQIDKDHKIYVEQIKSQ